jgi:hypothetical protein
MGYFVDVFNLLLLKDNSYRKVGNDKNALKKFIIAYLISSYFIMFIFGSIIFIGVSILTPGAFESLPKHLFILLFIFLIFPFVWLIVIFILTFIPHIIGLAFGGKPKSYADFFKVLEYPTPIITPLILLFSKVLGPIFGIWYFFLLYKTYKLIHKMSPGRAGAAVAFNVFLEIFFAFFIAIIFFYLARINPAFMDALRNP